MSEKQIPENFEEAMAELEQIINQLESGQMPLEESLNAFKRGITLSQYCQKTLKEAEETVTKLMTANGEVDFDE